MGQVEIFQLDRAGSVGVGHVLQDLIGPPGDFARFRIDDLFIMLYPLLAVTGFGLHLLRQRVLFFKQAIQEAVHAVNLPFPVGMSGYEGNQCVRVVPDSGQIILKLVVLRMLRGIAVDFLLKLILQSLVVAFGSENIFVFGRIGGDHQRLQSALQKRGAGGKAVDQHSQQQEQRAAQRISLLSTAKESLYPVKRSQHRVLPACCLRSVIGFSDSLLLPPAGEGIAGKRGFLLQRADVGLVQLVFSFFQLPVGLELVGTVGMFCKASCSFSGFLSMIGRLHTGIFLLYLADLAVNFRQRQAHDSGRRGGWGRLWLFLKVQAYLGLSGGFPISRPHFLFRTICPKFIQITCCFFCFCLER